MTTVTVYILKWALCLALLYIPFALLLRKETFATFNRWLLIGIIVVSGILPSMEITYPVEVEIVRFIDTAGNTISDEEADASCQLEGAGHAVGLNGIDSNGMSTMEIISIIHIIGIAIAMTIYIVEAIRITTGIRRRTVTIGKHNGMTLHCHKGETAPFSWFGHVVISRNDYNECGKEILLHEEGHCRNGHSWDMFMLSIVKSLHWFNPFAYMLACDMKEIHEYEADMHVLKYHGDTRAYQLLLLKKAVGETEFSLANNFSQSSIRKRIMMMARKPSGWIKKVKALSLAPMAILFLFIFAEPEYVYSIIERVALPDTGGEKTDETFTYAPVALESMSLRLPEMQAAELAVPEEIEPIKEIPLSAQATRLAEKFEEHATRRYYEYIDIEDSELGSTLKKRNVKKCSVRIQFISDKEGNAHSISAKGCNLSIAGSWNDNIEECKEIAIRAVTEHIMAKKWSPAIRAGESICTVYDAHMMLNFGETRNNDSNSQAFMAGSTPIN